MHRIATAAARALLIIIAAGFIAALASLIASAHATSQPQHIPTLPRDVDICRVAYALAPGERSVLLCLTERPRKRGPVMVQSGHEHVDAVLVRRLYPGRTVIALINRSAEVVEATAIVETY